MDEIITRWATDLTKYQKDFREQAEKVAEWDRMLVENGTKVQKLYGSTVDAERATQEVERQLASVEGQQDELASWLDRYEREVDEMMSKQVGPGEALQGPDQERERTYVHTYLNCTLHPLFFHWLTESYSYKLAEKLSERLDDMGKDLTSMIEEVNSASSTLSKTNKADEPVGEPGSSHGKARFLLTTRTCRSLKSFAFSTRIFLNCRPSTWVPPNFRRRLLPRRKLGNRCPHASDTGTACQALGMEVLRMTFTALTWDVGKLVA